MTPRLHWLVLSGLLCAVVLCAACTRGVDQERLQSDLQSRLDQGVKANLLQIVALRREGSAPLPAQPDGAARVIVYYNATLKLAQDYSFGSWDQLGPSTVAFALGATDKGIFGLQHENHAGDLVRVYGSAVYEQTDGGWKAVATAPAAVAAAPEFDGTAPPSRSRQLIDKLAALIELPPPGVSPQQDEIIADELSRASENIERRVQRRQHTFTIASGPADGEYARTTAAIMDAIARRAAGVQMRQRNSDGSVDNAWLIARGDADYGIVQGDVAVAAVAGDAPFSQSGPITTLRAVGALFPESIHIVVLPDSPIRDVAQLRGTRVNIGPPNSGTRFDAIGVLEAYGMSTGDLKATHGDTLTTAIARLQRRQIDALFATASAPTRLLQQLAVGSGLRLLSMDAAAVERLMRIRPGLTPITLPSNTYPHQKDAVVGVASAALLVTTLDAPQGEVERLATLVFQEMPQRSSGSHAIPIPLHPGAALRR